MDQPLSPELLRRVDAYWRAANYLAVGQIYLYDNPLLREPLKPEHIKPRLLGHWGTTPGQIFIYVHLNRPAADVGRRADRVLGRLRAIDGNVPLFSHSHFLRVLAARWLGDWILPQASVSFRALLP